MKIAVACDHGGLVLKNTLLKYLNSKGYEVKDFGTCTEDSCDYPDYALPAAEAVARGECERGILICSTGIGISIAANRHKGIRAALLYSDEAARLAKLHNNANIAVFGGRTMSVQEMKQRLDIFLNTEFEGGRHIRRLEKLDVYGGC